MSTKRDFRCPHCNGQVRVNTKIILGVTKVETGEKGLVLLSPKPGNYEVITHPNFLLKDGDKLELYCPACGKSLRSKEKPDLCELIINVGKLYFAPDKGKNATFVVRNSQLKCVFGVHASEYSPGFKFPGYGNHEFNEEDAFHASRTM
jgi:transcription elongation factor Elf1